MEREQIIRMAREAGLLPNYEVYEDDLERFADLVSKHTLANIDPSKFMSWQEGFEAGRTQQNKELEALREYAAGRCTINTVTAALGPMSLWSKDSFEKELEKARAEEREECADIAENWRCNGMPRTVLADQIRARGQS